MVMGLTANGLNQVCAQLSALAARVNVPAWVTALRSGDYIQGRSYLSRDGQFCCLGVLCEVMQVPFIEEVETGIAYSYRYRQYGVSLAFGTLPSELAPPGEGAVALPFTVREGDWVCVQPVVLYEINDEHRLTFDQIADLVEFFVRPNDPDYQFLD